MPRQRAAARSRDTRGAPGPSAPPAAAGDAGPSAAPRDPSGRVLDLLVLAVAAVHLVLLWRQAAPAVFASDECFHAHVATWIAGHGRLPRELPEFYSGLPYFYPPLFHLLGAAAVAVAGAASLATLNVVLTGALVALLFALPVPGVTRTARRCAILLCLGVPALSLYAVRFYAETLAALLAALVLALLLRARARPGAREGLLLGLATGAALLAKQPAAVLPVLLAALAAIDLARGRRAHAATLLTALIAALAVGLPFFVRNHLLFGGPFYPPVTDPAGVTLDAMNTRLFSLAPPVFYRNALTVMGPLVPWLALAALGWRLARGRVDLTTGLLAASLAFVALAPFVPRFQPRHLNPVTVLLAVLGSLTLAEALVRRARVALAVQALLLVAAALMVPRLTGLRAGFDAAPADLEAYRAVGGHVPAGGTVLSRLTYDTAFHGGRNATWPVPWSRSAAQLALFSEQDPERFLAGLDRAGIDHLLVPRRAAPGRFNGANHPASFVACVAALVERGRLTVLWASPDQVLVGRVRPPASPNP